MNNKKPFSLGKILSITTGKLVSENHIDGVYEILNHMTGQSLFTHQLPGAMEQCAPVLLKALPQLAGIDATGVNKDNWLEWITGLKTIHGEELEVPPLIDWKYSDPVQSAVDMMGKDRVIVLQTAPTQTPPHT